MPEAPSTNPKSSGMKIGSIDLGKKVGPLPIWAWGLIAGTIIGLYLYSRRGDSEDMAIEEEDTQAEFEEDEVGEGPGWTAFPPPTTPSPAPPDTYSNNREWGVYAVNIVNQHTELGYNPAAVQNAIARYLAKEPLSDLQFNIVSDAIRLAGAPPNPLTIIRQRKPPGGGGGGGGNPPPKPRPTPGDSKWHLIRSRKESLAAISRRYYANPEARRGDIFNANREGKDRPGPTKGWMKNPNDIRPGKWLYIPGPTKDRRPQRR